MTAHVEVQSALIWPGGAVGQSQDDVDLLWSEFGGAKAGVLVLNILREIFGSPGWGASLEML